MEVIRSRKRRKTVHAELLDGVVRVHVPAWIGPDEEREVVADLVAKLERRYTSTQVDLEQRARQLAARYDLPEPSSIRWADNQLKRWGSCSMPAATIRVSTRLAPFPPWVLDAVIVHELAHLVEHDHNARFAALVARYPLTEKADGFLLGVLYRDDGPGDDGAGGSCSDRALDAHDQPHPVSPMAPAKPSVPVGARPARHRTGRPRRLPDPDAPTLF